MMRNAFLSAYDLAYQYGARPLIFKKSSAQEAHHRAIEWLTRFDQSDLVQGIFSNIRRVASPIRAVSVGGVHLPSPLILAAGFVKGYGFASEADALQAVQNGVNIIPGWRTMPKLINTVEFGSFTPYPRLGNEGTVIWRDARTQSTQNRVGLKNPGAKAAAAFLANKPLSPHVGINIAVSPGGSDPDQEEHEVLMALNAFLDQNIPVKWFTLNLSCPNTEDDPSGNQSEAKAKRLCGAMMRALDGHNISLWVKLSPNLGAEQYTKLMRACAEVGVGAVIATNTLAMPSPDNPSVMAGVGGRKLHLAAVDAAQHLMRAKQEHGYAVDVIGCGGVMNRATYHDFVRVGVDVVQYWSALVYRGPLAAAAILKDY